MEKGARQTNVSLQSTKNINPKIEMIERKSAMMGTRPSEKISLMASISLMVLVVRVPIGV